MKASVIYGSPFVPAEWILAHGLVPRRLVPATRRRKDEVVSEVTGVCPYMRALVNEACAARNARGLVLATRCDQMRRGADHVETRGRMPVFLLNLPSTWQTAASFELYHSELERLGTFLVGLGGSAPSRSMLRTMMTRQEDRRVSDTVCVLPRSRSGLRCRGPSHLTCQSIPKDGRGAVRVALAGGGITQSDLKVIDIIRRAGADIVLDATDLGERAWPDVFDRRKMRDDPLRELARAYFQHIPDVFQRPNTRLYKWMKEKIPERDVSGVVILRQVWCDKWHAEVARLKELLGVPVLDIDVDGEDLGVRHKTAISAFVEELR